MTVPHPEILVPAVLGSAAFMTAISFTAADINTAIVGITALVAAVGIVIVNIISARAAAKQRAEQILKLDKISAKAEVIEGHVNSATAKSDAIIESQQKQMAMLRETIVKLEQSAALVAQAKAVADTSMSVAQAGSKVKRGGVK